MILFILIIAIAAGFYVLGAKNGIPKFGIGIGKSKEKFEERFEFLASLQEGDKVKTYNFDDDDSIDYDFTRTYTVVRNDPENQEIMIKEWNGADLRPYDSKFFKDVIKKNESLVQTIIKRNREKNESKEENND